MALPVDDKACVDVLIIGAGPAGLMAANAFATAGVNFRIIDQRPLKVAAGQADGIQSRTIEVLQSYGLADRLLSEGTQGHAAAFYHPDSEGRIKRTSKIRDTYAEHTRYPFSVLLNQGAIESIFIDSMASMGTQVERPVMPISLELSSDMAVLADPQAHAVTITLKHLDLQDGEVETEVVHAKYVLGCDGAHSWIRKILGIDFEGNSTEYIWGVLDLIPDTNFPDIRNRSLIHSQNGSCMVIPREGNSVRLYVQLTEKDITDPTTGRIDKAKKGPNEIFQVAKQSFYPYHMDMKGDVLWHALYIIGQRVASKFSIHERLFIAGDACHTHSPKAGQGMNAGMNDTHNLAWKIVHVLRGWAGLPLLSTYEAERRKYALELINFDKTFSRLFSGKPRTRENQDGVTNEQFLQAFTQFGLFTSGIGVRYNPSTIVGSSYHDVASNINIGERMPPHIFVRAADFRPYEIQDLLPADTRFKIIVFAGDTSDVEQMRKVRALAGDMSKPTGFVSRFGRTSSRTIFDIMIISSAKKEDVYWADFPDLFKSQWSKVLVDDIDMHGRSGGGGYAQYGIGPSGAVLVVRPDGFVGTIAPIEGVDSLTEYFSRFMLFA